MVLLRGLNYDYSGQQSTILKEAVNAGKTTIKVDNTEGFANNDYLIIDPLVDKCEIVKIGATIAKNETLTISATKFAHAKNVKVYRTNYNQMKFYESATETGTYVEIASSATEMSFTENYTNYDDTTATADYYYKRTFYNSTSTAESVIADSTSWQPKDEDLSVTPEEMRTYLQFDKNDFPTPADMRFFIKIAAVNVSLDLNSSNTNVVFIATLYNAKAEILRALATKAVSKGYVQVNAEGRTITKAYQELVLEAENVIQEYKAFLVRNGRREATSTNFMDDTTLVDSWTRKGIIDIMNGTSNAIDAQSTSMRYYFDGIRNG